MFWGHALHPSANRRNVSYLSCLINIITWHGLEADDSFESVLHRSRVWLPNHVTRFSQITQLYRQLKYTDFTSAIFSSQIILDEYLLHVQSESIEQCYAAHCQTFYYGRSYTPAEANGCSLHFLKYSPREIHVHTFIWCISVLLSAVLTKLHEIRFKLSDRRDTALLTERETNAWKSHKYVKIILIFKILYDYE
jgi:hypothetical protein